MGFKSWAAAEAILYLVKDAKRKDLIPDLVSKIEAISKENLGGYSERIQLEVIENVLLPVCRELVKDSPESGRKYQALIEAEYSRLKNINPKGVTP